MFALSLFVSFFAPKLTALVGSMGTSKNPDFLIGIVHKASVKGRQADEATHG
jgi:hypothetical protein